ncbi:MAG: DinB family protein [Gemmatimonadaceae bacterium]|nr:DinB family protein [Gemmatimonadaceae bacterium]
MHYTLPDAIAILSRTPRTLHTLLSGLPSAWTDATEGTGTWSPRAVVAHLLSADSTNWIGRARIMLSNDGCPALPAFDPNAQVRDWSHSTLDDLLSQFERVRRENIALLVRWKPGEHELARTAMHPEFGIVTMSQLLSTWVAHDLSHIGQIARVMARQYQDAVGPWATYLRIMQR